MPTDPCSASGDGADLESTLQRHLPGLHAYVRLRAGRLLMAKESAADLVQSACREVLEDLSAVRFESEGMLRHWLYQAAERKIMDRARYWNREKRDAGREARGMDDSALVDAYRSFCSPSRAAIAREEMKRVETAFAKLPESAREVIVLSRVVGLSHSEIAAQMGRSEGAVRTLLSRALARLALLLE